MNRNMDMENWNPTVLPFSHGEERTVKDCWILKDENRISFFCSHLKAEHPDIFSSLRNTEILELMKAQQHGLPTAAGLMVFSEYPQAVFPGFCLRTEVIPGIRHEELAETDSPCTDCLSANGSLVEMLEEAVDFIMKNAPRKRSADPESGFREEPVFPRKVIQELVLNALLHRDYSCLSEYSPIRAEIYADRIEISNPKSPFRVLRTEKLGKENSEAQNPVLCQLLECLGVCSNRSCGLMMVRRELDTRGLPEPVFTDTGPLFKAVLHIGVNESLFPGSSIRIS